MVLLSFNIISPGGSPPGLSAGELLRVSEDDSRAILRILEVYNCRATFFVEVGLVERLMNLLKYIVQKGHEVALYDLASQPSEIAAAKAMAENFIGKNIIGYRSRERHISSSLIKALGFTYISPIEHSDVFFPFKRLVRSTQITEENGVATVPESISPYSQIPYNDFSFQLLPMKYYKNMVLETVKNEDFVLIYLNSWQFTDLAKHSFRLPLYRKWNSGKKMEDKLEEFLCWLNDREIATSRMKDFLL